MQEVSYLLVFSHIDICASHAEIIDFQAFLLCIEKNSYKRLFILYILLQYAYAATGCGLQNNDNRFYYPALTASHKKTRTPGFSPLGSGFVLFMKRF